jgi:hypothetical protein
MGPARLSVLLLCVAASACSLLEAHAYDQWRAFHRSVAAMSAAERAEHLARLREQDEEPATAIEAMRRAYLITVVEMTPDDRKAATGEIDRLLDRVEEGHALVPVRDLLRVQAALQSQRAADREVIGTLQRQCDGLREDLGATRRQRDSLQALTETCSAQLQALKEIESVMSVNDSRPESQP